MVSGIGRILLIGSLVAGGLWPVTAAAQAVVGDPTNPAKTFASNCSACHKSPQGLAKGGNVASFLRQHYTTGAAMSSAMASYLASVATPPPAKQAAPADARKRREAPARTDAAINEASERQTERIPDVHRPAVKQKTVATQPNDQRTQPNRSRPTATAASPTASIPEAPAATDRPAAPAGATAALGNPEAAVVEPLAQPPAYPPPMPVFPPPEEPDQPAFSSAPLP
jgi:hypothetical protein